MKPHRTARALRAASAAGLLLLLAACSFPPYDENLSLGALSARKMTLTNVVGPLYLWSDESQDDFTIHLLPFKEDLAGQAGWLNGYLALEGDSNLQIHRLYQDGFRYWLGSPIYEGLYDADPQTLHLALDVALESYHLNLYFLGSSRRQIRAYNPGGTLIKFSGAMNENMSDNLLTLLTSTPPSAGATQVVGVTPVTEDSPTERVLLLWTDGLDYRESVSGTDSTYGLTTPALLRGPLALPSTPLDRGSYGHHAATGTSYLSVYDPAAGRYRTWRWDGSLVVTELAGLERRIDTVLANGLLYSQDHGWGTVYSAAGSEITRFPLGDMRLACEVYVAGVPTLYFTLPAWGGDKNDGEYLVVMVYSLPTSEIDSL